MRAVFHLRLVEQPEQGFRVVRRMTTRSEARQNLLLPRDVRLALGDVSLGHGQVHTGVVGHTPNIISSLEWLR